MKNQLLNNDTIHKYKLIWLNVCLVQKTKLVALNSNSDKSILLKGFVERVSCFRDLTEDIIFRHYITELIQKLEGRDENNDLKTIVFDKLLEKNFLQLILMICFSKSVGDFPYSFTGCVLILTNKP